MNLSDRQVTEIPHILRAAFEVALAQNSDALFIRRVHFICMCHGFPQVAADQIINLAALAMGQSRPVDAFFNATKVMVDALYLSHKRVDPIAMMQGRLIKRPRM